MLHCELGHWSWTDTAAGHKQNIPQQLATIDSLELEQCMRLPHFPVRLHSPQLDMRLLRDEVILSSLFRSVGFLP